MTLLTILATATTLNADEVRFSAAQGSHLALNGDSTLHKYTCNTKQIFVDGVLVTAPGKRDAQALRTAILAGKMTSWQVRIPVAGLKSGSSGLDENLQKALRSSINPDIVFQMKSYHAATAADGDTLQITATGVLRVAGKSRTIQVVTLVSLTANAFTISGKKDLKMTDYEVEPPVLFLGTVSTDDAVSISFYLNMQVQ